MANMKAQEVLYAVVGAGDFVFDKVKNIPKYADRKTTQKYYKDFVKRGKNVTTSFRDSAPAKRTSNRTATSRRPGSKSTTTKAAESA